MDICKKSCFCHIVLDPASVWGFDSPGKVNNLLIDHNILNIRCRWNHIYHKLSMFPNSMMHVLLKMWHFWSYFLKAHPLVSTILEKSPHIWIFHQSFQGNEILLKCNIVFWIHILICNMLYDHGIFFIYTANNWHNITWYYLLGLDYNIGQICGSTRLRKLQRPKCASSLFQLR